MNATTARLFSARVVVALASDNGDDAMAGVIAAAHDADIFTEADADGLVRPRHKALVWALTVLDREAAKGKR